MDMTIKAMRYTIQENPHARYILAVNIVNTSLLEEHLLKYITDISYDVYYRSSVVWNTLFHLGNLYPRLKVCGSIDQYYPRISITCNFNNHIFTISTKNPANGMCSQSFASILFSRRINLNHLPQIGLNRSDLPQIGSNRSEYGIINLCPFYHSYHFSTQFDIKENFVPELRGADKENLCKFEYPADFWKEQDESVRLHMQSSLFNISLLKVEEDAVLEQITSSPVEFEVAPKSNMFYKSCDVGCSDEEIYEKAVDDAAIFAISRFPNTTERRIISFSLYGGDPKYTWGAVGNAELVDVYFPGWICRFYIASDVPKEIRDKLAQRGAEVIEIAESFRMTRFMVLLDSTAERIIVRDSDSRLNARDRFAVQAWIDSGQPLFSSRDHVNHCHGFNAGMWGGTKDALPDFKNRFQDVMKTNEKNEFWGDTNFLATFWNEVKNVTFQIDSYCCNVHENTHPFPTRRPLNYLHVGQVFDQYDNPRMSDITNYITGLAAHNECIEKSMWLRRPVKPSLVQKPNIKL